MTTLFKYSDLSKGFNSHDDMLFVIHVDGVDKIITAEHNATSDGGYRVSVRTIKGRSFGDREVIEISGDKIVKLIKDWAAA